MAAQCEPVCELIPWVVNGTAHRADVRLVHGHIAQCAACRSEYVSALALARRMESLAGEMPGAPADLWSRIAVELPAETGSPAGGLGRLLEQLFSAAGMAGVAGLVRDAVELPDRGDFDPYAYVPSAWVTPSQA